MSMHKISGLEGRPIDDAGSSDMDEDSFRKLAEEARRPLRAGAPLFRAPPEAVRPLPRGPVLNLPVPLPQPEPPDPLRVWRGLSPVTLDHLRAERNGLFTKASPHPAAAAFDILRTRTLIACHENGWRRIAVTAPRHGCGTTTLAANLALSLARRPDARILLLDFDLRQPSLAARFGLRETNRLREMLTGAEAVESHLLRAGPSLALGLNGRAEEGAAELLQSPETAAAVGRMIDSLDPEVVVFDLPPALDSDDVMAGHGLFDAVLLVADGTRTTAADVTACERLFNGHLPLLGVVLNRSQELALSRPWRRRRRR